MKKNRTKKEIKAELIFLYDRYYNIQARHSGEQLEQRKKEISAQIEALKKELNALPKNRFFNLFRRKRNNGKTF